MSTWELILFQLVALFEKFMANQKPTPPREATLRILIVTAGMVLIITIMVAGGAAGQIEDVLRYLPLPR